MSGSSESIGSSGCRSSSSCCRNTLSNLFSRFFKAPKSCLEWFWKKVGVVVVVVAAAVVVAAVGVVGVRVGVGMGLGVG